MLKKINDYLEETLLIIIVLLIVFVMMLQVFMRKVVGTPLIWPEEFCRYLFLWSGYISIAYCFKHRLNLKIDFVVERLPKGAKKVLENFSNVVLIIFMAAMFYNSIHVFNKVSMLGQKSPALGLSMNVIYFAPIFGFGLGLFRFVQSLIKPKEV